MDTTGQRYCWARRAELALAQNDPALALDIADRVIASAPGMGPGRVATFLWKLRGEAMGAMGDEEEGRSLLQAAIESAQATGERFLLWRLYASLGQLCRAAGRQAEAEQAFSTARTSIQELAGTIPRGEMRDDFLHRAQRRLEPSG
jgi:tetratricopeptide (TPR) repeat protein